MSNNKINKDIIHELENLRQIFINESTTIKHINTSTQTHRQISDNYMTFLKELYKNNDR